MSRIQVDGDAGQPLALSEVFDEPLQLRRRLPLNQRRGGLIQAFRKDLRPLFELIPHPLLLVFHVEVGG